MASKPKRTGTVEAGCSGTSTGVFIHCLPRVGSTWLAYKFRNLPGVGFRFEPLHPNLIDGTPRMLQESYRALRLGLSLRHPPRREHYHREYKFSPEGGVPLFLKRFCYESYYMRPDQQDAELAAYLHSLWVEASELGAPLFKCTRSALRARWISHILPGRHIYVFRDPRLMDNSNFSFRGYSNPYIRDYALIIGQNSENPIFKDIADWSGLTRFIASSLGEEYAFYRRQIRDHSPGRYDREFHFMCLIFFWLIALALATSYADLIISMDMLCSNRYRSTIESAIREMTGVVINLSDYRAHDAPLRRAVALHSYAINGDVLAMARGVLKKVNPCWTKIPGAALAPFARDLIQKVQ